jgi:hypothetical protein
MAARKYAANAPPPMATSIDDNDFVSPPPKRQRVQQGVGPSNPAPQMDNASEETIAEPK